MTATMTEETVGQLTGVTEDPRMAARREQRKRMAVCERAQLRVNELDAELRNLDARADEAADVHRERTAPVQEELATIEEKILAAMSGREPIDPAVELRRTQLLQLVSDANHDLELNLAALKELRKPVEQQRDKSRMETTELTAMRNKLAQPPLADPSLLVEQFVAQQRAAAMQSWERNARSTFERVESELAAAKRRKQQEPDLLAILEGRFARWNATVLAAAQQSFDAIKECDQFYQQMIGE